MSVNFFDTGVDITIISERSVGMGILCLFRLFRVVILLSPWIAGPCSINPSLSKVCQQIFFIRLFPGVGSVATRCPLATPTPKCHGIRSLLVVLFLLNLPVVPHGTKGTGPKFVTRPACASFQLRNDSNTNYFNPIDMFIDWSLYMAHRCLSLPGTPDLWTRLGWLQGSTRNGMKWGALTLLEISHSRGCYLKFAVLLVQRVCSPKRPNTKDPRPCPLEAYIAGDTLCLQPIGAGHVTVL